MQNKTMRKTTTNTVQAYSYASAYAIQTTPIANDEDGIEITNFIAENPIVGETSWASGAMLFDTPEDRSIRYFFIVVRFSNY